jgi:hypothetical protein
VSAVLVLMAGMVFSAEGFVRGSVGYNLITFLVSGTIIVATLTFVVLLAFEVYRSVKFAEAHALARQVEEEAVEEALLGRQRRRTAAASANGGTRRQSLGRRLSVALGRSSMAPSPVDDGAVDTSEGTAGFSGDGAGELRLQRRGSSLSESVARQRRQSLLGRLQGLVSAGLNSSGGRGGLLMPDVESSEDRVAPSRESKSPSGVQSVAPGRMIPPPPLSAARGGQEVVSPPPSLLDDSGNAVESSGAHRQGIVSTILAAPTATRNMRVHTMASKERGSAVWTVHQEPEANGLQAAAPSP